MLIGLAGGIVLAKKSSTNSIVRGACLGFIGGSTNYFLWYKLPILPIGNILVSVYVGSILMPPKESAEERQLNSLG